MIAPHSMVKMQQEIDAKNREIGDLWLQITERDAEIERLKAQIADRGTRR